MHADPRTSTSEKSADPGAPDGRAPVRGNRAVRWVKRVGVLGLLFFTVKGLLWIAIPALIARGLL